MTLPPERSMRRSGSAMRRLSLLLDRIPIVLQVTAVVSLVLIVMLAGSLLAVSSVLKSSIRATAGGSMESVAIDLADRLDEGLHERFRDITALAASQSIAEFDGRDDSEPRRWIETMRRNYPLYAWIGLTDPSGRVLVASGSLLEGLSVAGHPWFGAALEGPHLGDVHDAVLLANLLSETTDMPASPDDEPLRLVDVAAPVTDADGDIRGVLGAHLSWAWAHQLQDALLTPRRREMQTRLRVLDREGRVLLGERFGTERANAESVRNVLAGQTGWGIEDLGSGPEVVGFAPTRGFAGQPGLGWVVLASTPLAVAEAPLARLNRTMAITGIVLGLLGLVVAMAMARRLGHPLTVLAGVARGIGRDTPQTLPRLSGSREVVSLSLALRALLYRIGAVTEHLQTSRERTQILEEEKRRLEQLASHDSLTGLRNRRSFLELAGHEIARTRRKGGSLCVLMIDIDHFKAVNDTYGHAAGDVVIRDIAHLIRDEAREADIVARFGGEEFVVLLPDCDFADARAFGERLRASVAAHRLRHDGEELSVTVSVGCAQFTPQATDLEAALDSADHALYIAKRSGRNRVEGTIVSSPHPPPRSSGGAPLPS